MYKHILDGGMQLAAGGSAGLVEVSIMHPLDLVKTRFQIQGGPNDPTRYKNLVDCFTKIVRQEGPLSFYKGILPPLLAETPKRATKFFTFEQYKRAFTTEKLSLPATFALAGLCSGLTEGFVICPFEVIKVKLQSERGVKLEEQKSTIKTAAEIYNHGGLGRQGLLKGLTATLMRHGVWNCIYFGTYHSTKQHYLTQDQANSLLYRFTIGLFAGTIASIANIPFDVAKSRIQGPQPVPGVIKYRTCTQSILLIFKEEGFLALYKGLVPKMLRLGPGGGIMLIVYESVYNFLKKNVN